MPWGGLSINLKKLTIRSRPKLKKILEKLDLDLNSEKLDIDLKLATLDLNSEILCPDLKIRFQ